MVDVQLEIQTWRPDVAAWWTGPQFAEWYEKSRLHRARLLLRTRQTRSG